MPPSAIDLVTLQDVASWSNMPSLISDPPDSIAVANAQVAITGWSDFVLWKTGRKAGYFTGDGNGNLTTFTETRDGSDSSSIGVLSGPIDASDPTKVLITINGQNIPQSTGWNVFGWFVEANPAFIGLRRGSGFFLSELGFGGRSGVFIRGKGNVQLTYPGGYNSCPPGLFEVSLRAINVIISKRLREDEGGRTTPQTGSVTSYRQFPWDRDILLALSNYTRTMLSGN